MRRGVAIAILGVITVVVGGGVLVYAYVNSEFTECFGSFESFEAAERAAQKSRDAGFDADVEERSGAAVIFESGETGNDAREFRRTFRQILRREGGELGHPGDGCLERPPFN